MELGDFIVSSDRLNLSFFGRLACPLIGRFSRPAAGGAIRHRRARVSRLTITPHCALAARNRGRPPVRPWRGSTQFLRRAPDRPNRPVVLRGEALSIPRRHRSCAGGRAGPAVGGNSPSCTAFDAVSYASRSAFRMERLSWRSAPQMPRAEECQPESHLLAAFRSRSP